MTVIRIRLREFLDTGQLGTIELGMSRETLREILGDPQDWKAGELKDKSDLWKYESIQFWFGDDEITYIGIYFQSPLKLPEPLSTTGFFPNETTDLKDFAQFLNDQGMRYHIDPALTFESQIALRMEFGARVLFDETTRISQMSIMTDPVP